MTDYEMKKIEDYVWEISKKNEMKVPVKIYSSDKLIEPIKEGRTIQQIINATTLPGIVRSAYVMPDGHEGYGFPIGGVAAFSDEDGIVSPGGVGYDINCGVRMIRTNLVYSEVEPKLKELVNSIFNNCPSGVGSKGKLRLNDSQLMKF